MVFGQLLLLGFKAKALAACQIASLFFSGIKSLHFLHLITTVELEDPMAGWRSRASGTLLKIIFGGAVC